MLLEKRAKDVFSEMKSQRIEVPVDRKRIEEAITGCLSVPDPLWALYRLGVLCLPTPQKLKEQLDKGGFIASPHHA